MEIAIMTNDKPTGKWDEYGTLGLSIIGGYIRQAYTSELYWPSCQPSYTRIWRSDPEVTIARHILDSLSGQFEIGWELPAHIGEKELDQPSDDDKRAVDFGYEVLDDLEGGAGEWLNSCLTRVPFFGWGWWEAVPAQRRMGWTPPGDDLWRSQYDDGLVGFRRLAFRDYSSFYAWDIDEYSGRVNGLKQLDIPNPAVTIPLSRSLHITYGDNNSPEGLATLETIWRLERIKYALEVVQGIGFEHTAGVLQFVREEGDLTATDKAEIKKAARAAMTAQEGNYLALPNGIKASFADVGFSAAVSILDAIKYYGVVKLSLFGMQWVALSATTGSGSYAAMSDSSSMMIAMLNSMAGGFVRQADHQIGKRLFEYPTNAAAFPGMTRRPRMVLKRKIDKIIPLGELGEFMTAMNAVMPLTEEDFRAVRAKSGFLPEVSVEDIPEEEPEVEPTPETEQTTEQEAENGVDSEGAPEEVETESEEPEPETEEPKEMAAVDELVAQLRKAVEVAEKEG
jgi:hypothetical protein